MKRLCIPLLVLAVLVWSAPVFAAPQTLKFGRFGTVTLYSSHPHPDRVVLFVSGDGGWNRGVVDMAEALATDNALVVGIDINRYFHALEKAPGKCSYPAADFEGLSQYVQAKLHFPNYIQPALVGYSSGATLVYAALVQAPPNTFRGAVSMGFCSDLPVSKPFCGGNGGLKWRRGPKGKGLVFLPAAAVSEPWIAFQGAIDQVCGPDPAADFARQVKGARYVYLPKVGHGYSVQRNWLPQLKEVMNQLYREAPSVPTAVASAASLKDLPLVEVPAKGASGTDFAVILSGDGGWASIDRQVAGVLAERGMPVVGFDSLRYYWTPRTPDGAAHDLARVIGHYLSAWHKKRVLLVGYSFGADVLPFLASRLPADLLDKVSLVALLSPGRTASFEFHLSYWLGEDADRSEPLILPELAKLKGRRILCLAGSGDKDSLCSDLPAQADGVRSIRLAGGHHFGGDYRNLADLILSDEQAAR
jgi:type IV secretory pathway VirJ component